MSESVRGNSLTVFTAPFTYMPATSENKNLSWETTITNVLIG